MFSCHVVRAGLDCSSHLMARTRSAERSRSKAVALEDIARAVEQFQELLALVEDFGREGFPYRDAARARAELRLRECIRRAFGDKSPEFQTHRNYKLLVGNAQETKQSLSFIKALMAALEDKKLELQGLKPVPPPEPPAPTPPPMPARPPQMKLVPPTTPTAQVTITPAAPVVPPPMTVSVALTTNLDMAAAPQAPPPSVQSAPAPPAATKPSAPVPTPPPPPAPAMKPAVEAKSAPPPQLSEPPAVQPSAKQAPVAQTQAAPPPVQPPVTQPKAEAPPAPASQPAPSTEAASKPTPAVFLSSQEAQDFVKHLCNRFHAVARQLRLRKEYRATLDVEDEFDAQDLLLAMLRLQFDDVETDEWTPEYAEGSPRKTFLLNHGRLAIIVKKTRPGLTAKELSDQIKTDAIRYSGRNRCAALLCFIYDPEGRIGNPRGLEADLTSVSDQFTVDVLVTPK